MAQTLLHQIVAVEKGVKNKAERELTDAYHLIQKAPPFNGIARTYSPKDDEGDHLPAESTLVQVKSEDVLDHVATALTRMFDVVVTKEMANTDAMADVEVEGSVLLHDVPVTYLLFLEKRLMELHAFISNMPVLDPSETWLRDEATGTWATPPSETTRTKKIPRNWVKAEATDKHPAQVEVYHEDVIVGTWTTRKFSGALPATRVTELLKRVDTLSTAVKYARERANTLEVDDQQAGDAIFGYLFA